MLWLVNSMDRPTELPVVPFASMNSKTRPRPPLGVLCLTLASFGCTKASSPSPKATEPTATPEESADAELQRLAMLGYLDYAETSPADQQSFGVLVHDEERSEGGFVLLSHIPTATADLIDLEGRTLRRWEFEGAERLIRARLLSNGDLLAVTEEQTWQQMRQSKQVEKEPRSLRRLDPSGAELWRLRSEWHHDARELEDGSLIALDSRTHLTDRGVSTRFRDELLTRLSADGEVLESRSLYEMLVGSPGTAGLLEPPLRGDVFHANSFAWIEGAALDADHPFFGGPAALVSVRELDLVTAFRWSDGEFLWSFGPGELLGQHEATLTQGGSVLLFDNGDQSRRYSRILTIDPRTNQIERDWSADSPETFYSGSRGTVQELPGGNLLVANSNAGEVFELDPGGAIVWHYRTPVTDSKGRTATLRAEWVQTTAIEPGPR